MIHFLLGFGIFSGDDCTQPECLFAPLWFLTRPQKESRKVTSLRSTIFFMGYVDLRGCNPLSILVGLQWNMADHSSFSSGYWMLLTTWMMQRRVALDDNLASRPWPTLIKCRLAISITPPTLSSPPTKSQHDIQSPKFKITSSLSKENKTIRKKHAVI